MTPEKLVIAFTCVGRRVQLVRHFRLACQRMGIEPQILGLDSAPAKAPGSYYCDEAMAVPAGEAPDFPDAVLDIVRSRRVGLLIPLADTDLPALGAIRHQVQQAGCLAACGGPQTVRITRDKLETYRFVNGLGLLSPQTRLLSEALAQRRDPLPAFVKPRFGSAGKNAFSIDSWELPRWLAARADQFVCQYQLAGQEVTVDLFIDPEGRARCAVPRHRLEIRGGEVTKSIVRRDALVEAQAMRLAEALPDAFGVINIQGFSLADGQFAWTEINPRFGGGSPLAIEAGANLAGWLVALAVGREPPYEVDLHDGLMMLRFDDAVYVRRDGHVFHGIDAEEAVQPPQPVSAPRLDAPNYSQSPANGANGL